MITNIQPIMNYDDPVHVDDFIDDPETDVYASWFLNLKRLPATLQFKFADQIAEYKLFAKYAGEWYRVTGASRVGDIWLTKDFNQNTGYQIRPTINLIEEFSREQPKI